MFPDYKNFFVKFYISHSSFFFCLFLTLRLLPDSQIHSKFRRPVVAPILGPKFLPGGGPVFIGLKRRHLNRCQFWPYFLGAHLAEIWRAILAFFNLYFGREKIVLAGIECLFWGIGKNVLDFPEVCFS